MEVVEVKKDKEYVVYPEGKKPIRIVVDYRIHGEPTPSNIGRGRPKAYQSTRTVRLPPEGASETAIGHEVGHIMMEHPEWPPGALVDKKFIKEELEAEYWAYSMGFPKRRYKIETLRELAQDIGMTKKQFSKVHREVRRRLKER